jgi:hypothetical protein
LISGIDGAFSIRARATWPCQPAINNRMANLFLPVAADKGRASMTGDLAKTKGAMPLRHDAPCRFCPVRA